ncbi:hypothetical protein EOPP23_04185 [Endozoicomonas sp. OPT23]|uniref:GIY-YIG nuclease family protein n=1 Tax=Endozoicomonas sp. OPT23 TaxID=2072845 RepID=UPI00129A8C0D|nr:GIY-YIG nuclease family protein [Endozoicomonas sp. OPT23]MRI32195.1 hypothetical protein [Endozoicomonas sp. OPT23]
MIIFTVTNKATKKVYVGSTRNDLESQWERMVAAAYQDMDYPLYREIRVQGEEVFTVEEWDRAESREELCELEQDAVDFFGAESLRGYKTSTVKILPKKKKRQRKSSIEKELASIFADMDDGDSDTPPSLAIKNEDENAKPETKATKSASGSSANKRSPAATPPPKKEAVTKESIVQTLATLKQEMEQEKAAEQAAAKAEKARIAEAKASGSRANAMVRMNNIELSDDITAQLAAITAAADACLAGDATAASQLEAKPEISTETEVEAEITTAVVVEPVEVPIEMPVEAKPIEKEITVAKPICPKELRIREAIERHRKQRAQRSSEAREQEKTRIASLLAELDSRARELHTGSFAAVA